MTGIVSPRPAVNGHNGIFSTWQPEYAARGIATFPVGEAKKPGIRGWQKVGLKGSAELAAKFKDADALGYVTGKRSNVTVLDVDTADEGALADALNRHGQAAIIVRTASGKFHALYRYNGERRQIRPWPELPIDLLGDNGYALASPSKIATGSYEIVHGRLDDLEQLRPMQNVVLPGQPANATSGVPKGRRNDAMWRHCMQHAHHCDNFDALLDVARSFNEDCLPPLEETEVMAVARSAWDYTERGQNRFGQHGAWFPTEEVTKLIADQDALILLAFLRAHNGPWADFMIANGLAEVFGWRRQRFTAARQRLLGLGYVRLVRGARQHQTAVYRWANQGVQKRTAASPPR